MKICSFEVHVYYQNAVASAGEKCSNKPASFSLIRVVQTRTCFSLLWNWCTNWSWLLQDQCDLKLELPHMVSMWKIFLISKVSADPFTRWCMREREPKISLGWWWRCIAIAATSSSFRERKSTLYKYQPKTRLPCWSNCTTCAKSSVFLPHNNKEHKGSFGCCCHY